MSGSRTPLRKPLGEMNPSFAGNTPSKANSTPFKNSTPRLSPGPALLHAMRLSAKKELLIDSTKLQELLENEEDKENGVDETTGSDIAHFRKLLTKETERIETICKKWESLDDIQQEYSNCQDEARLSSLNHITGCIRTAVGQGRLIIRERFHQFKGLVDNCEFKTSEKVITCEDLHGFWDMIFFQVEDVDNKFSLLEKCREANWDVEVILPTKKEMSKKVTKRKIKKAPKVSAETLARREEFAKKRAEARRRLAVVKNSALSKENESDVAANVVKIEVVTFDAGFFKIDSPVKSPNQRNITPRVNCKKKQFTTPGSASRLHSNHITNIADAPIEPSQNHPNTNGDCMENAGERVEIIKRLQFDEQISSDCGTDTANSNIENKITRFGDVEVIETEDDKGSLADEINHKTVKYNDCTKEASVDCSSSSEEVLPSPDTHHDASSNGPPGPVEQLDIDSVCNQLLSMCLSSLPGTQDTSDISANKIQDSSAFTDILKGPLDHSVLPELQCPPYDIHFPVIPSANISFNLNDSKSSDWSVISVKAEPNADHDGTPWKDLAPKIEEPVALVPKVLNSSSGKKKASDSSEMVCNSQLEYLSKNMKSETETKPHAQEDNLVLKRDGMSVNVMRNLIQESVEKMLLQMSFLQNTERNSSQPSEEIFSEIDKLKSENETLRNKLLENVNMKKINFEDIDRVKELLFKEVDFSQEESVSDDLYKPHYYRLLGVLKLYDAELQGFNSMQSKLNQMQKHLTTSVQKLNEKTFNLEQKKKDLEERELKITRIEEKRKEDVLSALKNVKDLTLELDTAQKELETCEYLRQEETHTATTLRIALQSSKGHLDTLEAQICELKEEKIKSDQEKLAAKEQLEITKGELDSQSQRVKDLESKMKFLHGDIEDALSQFQMEIKKRDDILETFGREKDELTSYCNRITTENKELLEKIETLEYEENERKSLQDDYAEAELSLERLTEKHAKVSSLAHGLQSQVEELKQRLSNKESELENTNEELDIVKAQAHLMVLHRQEEIVYADSGLKEILELLNGLHSKLCSFITANVEKEETSYGQSASDTPYKPPPELSFVSTVLKAKYEGMEKLANRSRKENKEDSQEKEAMRSHSDSECLVRKRTEMSMSKNADTLPWHVDKGIELAKAITDTCAALQSQYKGTLEHSIHKNSFLNKQLASAKETLSEMKNSENELEEILQKRIANLIKENEMKCNELDNKIRTIHSISDQVVQLTHYKTKYERMVREFGISSRERRQKRRSSSVGSLKLHH